MGVSECYQNKMSPVDKVCSVCGDKALGYNFNAVTCESCKAFFRRNALSSKDFSCPFNETCEITVVTRRFCQRCRLEKCFKIGMRKELIMSEENKLAKRKKVEQNRAKRKSKMVCTEFDESLSRVKKETDQSGADYWCYQENMLDANQIDTSPYSTTSHNGEGSPSSFYQSASMATSSMSPTSSSLSQFAVPPQILQQAALPTQFQPAEPPLSITVDNTAQTIVNNAFSPITSTTSTVSLAVNYQTSPRLDYPNRDSSANDIVNFFLNHPEESGNYINYLMPNQKLAMEIVTKIIHSQKDAMRMIGYLIGTPGDALKIISKIMNSPYDALAVFTKFVGSPNDALEIIAKCVNSPTDVLQFINQLMSTPANAVEIVNKFMNSPAEAMKMLNDLVNTTMVDSTTKIESGNVISMNSTLDTLSTTATTTTKSSEISTSDFVTDTINYTKSVSNPIVRNLLESVHGDHLNTMLKQQNPKSDTHQSAEKYAEYSDSEPKMQTSALESIISNAINIEYNINGREPSINRELNDSETAKLNELIVAYKALFVPLDEDITPLVTNRNEHSNKTEKNPQDPQLLTLINLTAIAIKRLIKMVKKINAFKNMCQEDQVALLKGGCTEMMILRSIMQYDVDHSIWNIPHSQDEMSSIKSDVLKLAKNNVYEEYENFIRTFDARLRKDENIILIMSAIVLFTPSRPKTVHTDVLILEQNSYYYLLRRYLESIYPGCEAKSLFLKLIRKIKELECLKDVIIAVYLDVNPNRVEPLLREIFDIKNSN